MSTIITATAAANLRFAGYETQVVSETRNRDNDIVRTYSIELSEEKVREILLKQKLESAEVAEITKKYKGRVNKEDDFYRFCTWSKNTGLSIEELEKLLIE